MTCGKDAEPVPRNSKPFAAYGSFLLPLLQSSKTGARHLGSKSRRTMRRKSSFIPRSCISSTTMWLTPGSVGRQLRAASCTASLPAHLRALHIPARTLKPWIPRKSAEQDAACAEHQPGVTAPLGLEAYLVAHHVSKGLAPLVRNTLSHTYGTDAPRLH